MGTGFVKSDGLGIEAQPTGEVLNKKYVVQQVASSSASLQAEIERLLHITSTTMFEKLPTYLITD
jgi:hypothetical protein